MKEEELTKNILNKISDSSNLKNTDTLIKQKDVISRNTSSNSITSLKENKYNFLRISIITSSITNIIMIFLTIFFYFFYGSSWDYHILLFEYKSDSYTPFETHAVSIVIFLLALMILFGIVSYSLIFQKEKEFIKIFSLSSFLKPFLFMNAVMIAFFFLCCFFKKTVSTSILNLILLISSTVCIVLNYKHIKIKKKLSPFTLVGISFFLSIIFAFNSYLILYNFSDLITINSGVAYKITNFKIVFAIIVNIIYWGICIVLLTLYKDIIFSLSLIVIEVGYASNSQNLSLEEIITGITIIAFIFISVIFMVLRYKNGVLGYEESEDLMEELVNDWKENMKIERENNKNLL